MERRAINPPIVSNMYLAPRLIVAYELRLYEGAWCIDQIYDNGEFDLWEDYSSESDARREFDKLTGVK